MSAEALKEKRVALANSIKLLTSHGPFKDFEYCLKQMREESIRTIGLLEIVDSRGKLESMVGEIRAYTDILDMIDENRASTTPEDEL